MRLCLSLRRYTRLHLRLPHFRLLTRLPRARRRGRLYLLVGTLRLRRRRLHLRRGAHLHRPHQVNVA